MNLLISAKAWPSHLLLSVTTDLNDHNVHKQHLKEMRKYMNGLYRPSNHPKEKVTEDLATKQKNKTIQNINRYSHD